MSRVVPGCPNYARLFSKILVASLIMGAGAWAIYGLSSRILGNNVAVLFSICVAVVIYAALIVLLRVINKDDLSLIPKGQAIGRLLHIK